MQPQPSDETTDLLVAYALGALEPEEMERVGRLLEERPELRALLAELRATADLLPYGLPEAAPPSELRARVLDHAVGRTARPAPAPDLGRRLRGWLYALGGLAAASLAALALALGQLGGLRAELAQAQQQLAQAQQQLAVAERRVAALDGERSALAQAAAGAVEIGRLEGEAGAATVLRSEAGELLVAARLPALAPDQVYQLWLIAGDGAPQSGGVFTVDASGFGVIALGPGAPAGVTLAVTAEPAPGSPGPTSTPLVAGQIT
jgi:anti-sigma-K factor RskA